MTADVLLASLRDRGISIEVLGGDLRYRARKGAFTSDLRNQVIDHKAGLLHLLRIGSGNSQALGDLPRVISLWPSEWIDQFEERAAIREFDGNLSREKAEQSAEADVRRMFSLNN